MYSQNATMSGSQFVNCDDCPPLGHWHDHNADLRLMRDGWVGVVGGFHVFVRKRITDNQGGEIPKMVNIAAGDMMVFTLECYWHNTRYCIPADFNPAKSQKLWRKSNHASQVVAIAYVISYNVSGAKSQSERSIMKVLSKKQFLALAEAYFGPDQIGKPLPAELNMEEAYEALRSSIVASQPDNRPRNQLRFTSHSGEGEFDMGKLKY